MYRHLCFLVLLCVTDGYCWHKRHCWHHRHRAKVSDSFDDVTALMSQVNKILKTACNSDRTTEAFEYNNFIITHHLPEYKEDYIDVVIKNSILQTTAKKNVIDKDKFWDLRVLPSNLDIDRASWTFVDNNLTIRLPFIEEKRDFCVKDDEDIKVVTKEIEKIYDIDIRFQQDVIH